MNCSHNLGFGVFSNQPRPGPACAWLADSALTSDQSGAMSRAKCCGCNGPMAVCRNCRCAKSNSSCISCYPSRKGRCENVDVSGRASDSQLINQASVIESNSVQRVEGDHVNNVPVESNAISEDMHSFRRGSVLDFVPKGSRILAARSLCNIINDVCDTNSHDAWRKLIRFSPMCFKKPKRGGKKQPSLATSVNRQIESFLEDPFCPLDSSSSSSRHNTETRKIRNEDIRAKLVGKKLANFDIKGAVRLISSDDRILQFDQTTLSQLRSKHPDPHSDSDFPSPPSRDEIAEAMQLTEIQVQKAIQSFPGGSAGGCDLLLPQHLKDLINKKSGEQGVKLLKAVTRISNKMLTGDIPEHIRPFLFGASLIAFSKPDGGIRPIAIGNTLRRLTAKAAANFVKDASVSKLFPHQLGVSIPGGAEAIVHAARSFCSSKRNSEEPALLLKIDFENAFNSIRRDNFLRIVKVELPTIYPYIYQCYSEKSCLFFNGSTIYSAEGVQQGDPLGPLCFSIAIQGLISKLTSDLNVWYLDDGTLAGHPDIVRADFEKIIAAQDSLGLKVNQKKCEFSVLCSSNDAAQTLVNSFNESYPEAKFVPTDKLNLLGSPLFQDSLDRELKDRLENFKMICSRLETLDHHDSLFLLKNVFHIPKLLYLLRTTTSYRSIVLKEFDACIKTTVESITNCHLDDTAFCQATLPVKFGGLGVRSTEDISLPAFIASSNNISEIVEKVIPSECTAPFLASLAEAVLTWKASDDRLIEPSMQVRKSQKNWDNPRAKLKSLSLIENAANDLARARLLASAAPKSGVWLNAIPVPALGLKLDNESLRISVALRLGTKLNEAYTCICGLAVDNSATHGLDCRRAPGKHARHSEANQVIHRALSSAGVSSILEPVGMCRNDGKRPDGATVIPWKQGKCLVWDFTCVNTIARSYITSAASQAGSPSTAAEIKKKTKYSSLGNNYIFTPIALETLGPWGPEADNFIRELGRRLFSVTDDPRSTSFLRQKLSIAVQRGNAACILGTLPRSTDD